MMQIVDPRMAIPIHYNDYDIFISPLSVFQEEVRLARLEHRVHYLSHGEAYSFQTAMAEPQGLDAVIDDSLSQG
jgi:L-ascorbate metabolism protein UlaG (beta-lactamase superfamily)